MMQKGIPNLDSQQKYSAKKISTDQDKKSGAEAPHFSQVKWIGKVSLSD